MTEYRQRVADLVAYGYTDRAIASELKRPLEGVQATRRRLGLEANSEELPSEHGTQRQYRRGCRCADCRAANTRRCERWAQERGMVAPTDSIPHGLGGYTNYGCRCEPCRAAQARHNADYAAKVVRDDQHGGAIGARRGCKCEPCSTYASRVKSSQNQRSLPLAHRHGQEWTGPEMEILLRADLTAREVGAMLGRSVFAVRTKRYLIRRDDPKATFLAGVGGSLQ